MPSERRAEIMRILTARRRETMGRLADEHGEKGDGGGGWFNEVYLRK